jgi:hypothetical protein
MVFNATFTNISAISRRSFLLAEEFGVQRENHRPVQVTDKDHTMFVSSTTLHEWDSNSQL